MQKKVTVHHQQYETKEMNSLPVYYEVLKDGNRTTYKCEVRLQEKELPEWLNIKAFEIPKIYTPGDPGVTVTCFSEIQGIKNIDTALFIGEVEAQISLCEILQ
jgi:hypothetical protein